MRGEVSIPPAHAEMVAIRHLRPRVALFENRWMHPVGDVGAPRDMLAAIALSRSAALIAEDPKGGGVTNGSARFSPRRHATIVPTYWGGHRRSGLPS